MRLAMQAAANVGLESLHSQYLRDCGWDVAAKCNYRLPRPALLGVVPTPSQTTPKPVRLFRTDENPRPDLEVVSIDFPPNQATAATLWAAESDSNERLQHNQFTSQLKAVPRAGASTSGEPCPASSTWPHLSPIFATPFIFSVIGGADFLRTR